MKNDQAKKIKMSKGFKKYVRREKARIRKEILNLEEQEIQIKELYNNLQNN